MANFTFNGSQTLVYPNLLDATGAVLVAIPGQTYSLATAPDAQWTAPQAPQSAPEAVSTAPEAPTAPTTTTN